MNARAKWDERRSMVIATVINHHQMAVETKTALLKALGAPRRPKVFPELKKLSIEERRQKIRQFLKVWGIV